MESDQLHTSHSGVFSPLRRDRQDQRGPYRSVSAGRSFSLACETPLPDPASEKYKQIANPAAIGSAMLCGVAGIAPQTVANSASYLQSWRRFLTTSSPRGLTSLSDFSSGTPPRERGEDRLAERIGFELPVEFPQHAFQGCSDSKSRIMAAKNASAGLITES